MNARLEKRRLGLALVSECCPLPFGYVRGGKLKVRADHDHDTHTLELTPAELRALADDIEKEGGTTWRV